MNGIALEPLRCGQPCNHELHTVEEIGDWTHDFAYPGITVREWAATRDIWSQRNSKPPYDELHAAIQAAGGITCEYALEGISLPGQPVHLSDGLHRWAIAAQLGLATVPVEMQHQDVPTPFVEF